MGRKKRETQLKTLLQDGKLYTWSYIMDSMGLNWGQVVDLVQGLVDRGKVERLEIAHPKKGRGTTRYYFRIVSASAKRSGKGDTGGMRDGI